MGFGKFITTAVCGAGALVVGTVLLPEIGAGILLSGATSTAATVALGAIDVLTTNAAIAAGTVAAGAAGSAAANAYEKAKDEERQNIYSKGVNAGAEGKENMRKAYEEEIKEKDAKYKKTKEELEKEREFSAYQDEIIKKSRYH